MKELLAGNLQRQLEMPGDVTGWGWGSGQGQRWVEKKNCTMCKPAQNAPSKLWLRSIDHQRFNDCCDLMLDKDTTEDV